MRRTEDFTPGILAENIPMVQTKSAALEKLIAALAAAPQVDALWAQFSDLIAYFNLRHPVPPEVRALLARALEHPAVDHLERRVADDVHFLDLTILPESPEIDGYMRLSELKRYLEWHKDGLVPFNFSLN